MGMIRKQTNQRKPVRKGKKPDSQNKVVITKWHQHITQDGLDPNFRMHCIDPGKIHHLMVGCPQHAQVDYTNASVHLLSACTEKSVGMLLFENMNYRMNAKPRKHQQI